MQTAVLALPLSFSPTIPFPKPPRRSPNPNLPHFSHIPFPSRTLSWRGSFCTFPSSSSSRGSNRKLEKFSVMASSVPESAGEYAESAGLINTMRLGSMFGIWYLLNIFFNIYNKQVLKVYPFPTTVTAFQFGCGTVITILMWAFNFHPKPKFSRSQFAAILPLAIVHTIGNILTNVSLGKVAVSFTHTIKAMEPFFTVLLSALFLAEDWLQ